MILTYIYFGIAIICVYPISEMMKKDLYMDDFSDKAFVVFMSCAASLFWPIVVSAVFMYTISKWVWKGVQHDKEADSQNQAR
jgi:hypothetical protein